VNAEKWSLIDDFAFQLRPDNLQLGHNDIRMIVTCLEEWAKPKLKRRDQALVGLSMGLIPLVPLLRSRMGVWLSNRTVISLSGRNMVARLGDYQGATQHWSAIIDKMRRSSAI
jgi:pyruvate dehydrogenase complex dehydrogenase (E1) component